MSKSFLYRPNCELCQKDKKTVLFTKKFTDPYVWEFLKNYYKGGINKDDIKGGQYEIVKCSQCGFIWQAYILNNELMKVLYNTWISPKYSLVKRNSANITFYAGYARQIEGLARLMPKSPSETDVLDFGMGWGYWCLMAKAYGYNVSGFEISRERIAFAKKNGIKMIEKISEISADKFDFINADQVFEHIPNPLETLRLLVGSLKSKGIIRISVPNGKKVEQALVKSKFKVSKNALHPLEHINCFKHNTLVKFGESAGLDLMKQPLLRLSPKGIIGKYYKQYFGTTLYLRKKV